MQLIWNSFQRGILVYTTMVVFDILRGSFYSQCWSLLIFDIVWLFLVLSAIFGSLLELFIYISKNFNSKFNDYNRYIENFGYKCEKVTLNIGLYNM